MSVLWLRSLASVIMSLPILIAAISCAPQLDPSFDPMRAPAWCDSTPMKPLGRQVEIPNVRVLAQFGTITGAIVQAETEDAVQGAAVGLMRIADGEDQPWRSTDSKGGFVFDSVVPGRYRLRARRVGMYPDTLTIHPSAGRVDTVRLRLRTYRCSGY